ncbi:MAG: DUF1127 domain-containing protein [Pseudomonadota bacterium]
MATYDNSHTTYGSATIASRIFALFTSIPAAIYAWNESRLTRNSLSALTDRELEDIGLTRGDIDSVADNALIR